MKIKRTTLAALALIAIGSHWEGPCGAAAAAEVQITTSQAGLKPHTGCYTNDRRDLNNQWCLWDGKHMHDGVGDRHDHSGYFDRGRNWHPRRHAVIHFACEHRCFS